MIINKLDPQWVSDALNAIEAGNQVLNAGNETIQKRERQLILLQGTIRQISAMALDRSVPGTIQCTRIADVTQHVISQLDSKS